MVDLNHQIPISAAAAKVYAAIATTDGNRGWWIWPSNIWRWPQLMSHRLSSRAPVKNMSVH
jgi:hypothetical protein